MHWPSCETGNGCGKSEEPSCSFGSATYNQTQCMLVSYSALVDVWRAGLTRSVGVSNFNVSHLQVRPAPHCATTRTTTRTAAAILHALQ